MADASSGSLMPGHIHCCPFQQSDDTLSDHCFWVAVFDALDLVTPLLKRHLSLPRSGITTKGVNSGGTHPQPGHKPAEEVVDICISPRETCRSLYGLAWSPPPWNITSLSSISDMLLSQATLKPPWGDPRGGVAPPSLLFPCEEP